MTTTELWRWPKRVVEVLVDATVGTAIVVVRATLAERERQDHAARERGRSGSRKITT